MLKCSWTASTKFTPEACFRKGFSFSRRLTFLQVTEEVDFRRAVPQGRRDLRPGKQTARCSLLPKGLYVEMSWGEPLAGQLTETYHIEHATLYVASTITVQDGYASPVLVRPELYPLLNFLFT